MRISPEAVRHLLGREAYRLELRPRLALNDEFIYQAAILLERTLDETDDLSQMLAQSVCLSIVYQVLTTYAEKPAGGRKPLALRRHNKQLLDQYIHDNLGEPILLDDLAALAKMTPHTLLRAFKVSFGATPASYIVTRRISAARGMLAYTDLDITTIAMASPATVTCPPPSEKSPACHREISAGISGRQKVPPLEPDSMRTCR